MLTGNLAYKKRSLDGECVILSTQRSAHFGILINFKKIKLANLQLDEVKLKLNY